MCDGCFTGLKGCPFLISKLIYSRKKPSVILLYLELPGIQLRKDTSMDDRMESLAVGHLADPEGEYSFMIV